MGEREEQNYPGDGVGEGFGFVLFSDERNLGMFIDCEEELKGGEGAAFWKDPGGTGG